MYGNLPDRKHYHFHFLFSWQLSRNTVCISSLHFLHYCFYDFASSRRELAADNSVWSCESCASFCSAAEESEKTSSSSSRIRFSLSSLIYWIALSRCCLHYSIYEIFCSNYPILAFSSYLCRQVYCFWVWRSFNVVWCCPKRLFFSA